MQTDVPRLWRKTLRFEPLDNKKAPCYNKRRRTQKAMSEYLTPREIAQILKVHPATVRRWIQERRLKAIRPGTRNYRVARTDFEAFLKERRIEAD